MHFKMPCFFIVLNILQLLEEYVYHCNNEKKKAQVIDNDLNNEHITWNDKMCISLKNYMHS
jgi:hypothetical protein